MADAPAAQKTSSFGFLARKIGPVPVWLIAVGAVGAWYWYTRYGPGSRKAAPAPVPSQPRTQIIEVAGRPGARGARGGRGPRGYRGADEEPRPVRRHQYAAAPRGPQPATVAPETVAAPMTGADVYGDVPTAMPDGSTYDSGDVATTMGAQYAVAG